jgi:hypothetical protein
MYSQPQNGEIAGKYEPTDPARTPKAPVHGTLKQSTPPGAVPQKGRLVPPFPENKNTLFYPDAPGSAPCKMHEIMHKLRVF